MSEVATRPGSLEVAHRLWGRLWKPDLASLHRTQGPVELNCELRTAHRKRLFVKQTYMYFMAATLLLFLLLGSNELTFQHGLRLISSAFLHLFFVWWATPLQHIHTLCPPIPNKIRLLFWQWPFLFSWRCEGQPVGVVLTDSGTLLHPPGQL